ncbi:hydantoinase/oxoprolinase family protein [Stygiolobus caldivivus]|uniref:5-oxoprolinase n=1 Tax=Stygiolobus caldivivus TaxID=2824673 RepID=A0A8D5ZJG3_9CREN|nr:hydantoinase/oxoprolinase family protein [Stygiolobus caldivivus]BCU70350.1 5-oxoprolinase [Stygiolobus caldivivus]
MSIVAVDVGGTFTDIIVLRDNGTLSFYKGLSTPKAPEIGVQEGLRAVKVGHVSKLFHATTIATNALLGQLNLELPRTALVTTKGFRDIIEIARQNRPELYNLYFEKPKPLIPRELRFEIEERVTSEGKVLKEPNLKDLDPLLEQKVEAVAISFLHSYKNPENEYRVKEYLSRFFKYVVASYEVSPEQREYERTSTTVINAILMPIVSKYVEGLRSLADEVYIMSSSGGLITLDETVKRPVQIIESGPAAGVIGAKVFAERLGYKNVISFDMGGTTAKAGTIVNGEIEITAEYEVGGRTHHGRIIKGSGYPVRFPFIDLAEVSAGGGTIIWRDEGGALRVGPISAGADPGPICYGRGGKFPTLTDAMAVEGRIGDLLSGEMRLDIRPAEEAISKLGDPLDVAEDAIKLASIEMARAIRLVTVERGLDPENFVLFAFGGAGPQFAIDVAEEVGVKEIIVPPYPGLFSALSLLAADLKFEARLPFPGDVDRAFEELERRFHDVDYFIRYIDARYKGQGWELTVRVEKGQDYRKAFEEKYMATYGYTLPYPVEVVLARVFGVKKLIALSFPERSSDKVKVYKKKVFLGDWVDVDVYKRESLNKGFRGKGPTIIEEYSSTIIVKDGWEFEVGENGSIVIRRS